MTGPIRVCRPRPEQWATLGRHGLRQELQRFLTRLVGELCEQRTPPRFVQIGNEITNGMLWPFGALLERDRGTVSWDGLVDLFNSAGTSVKAAAFGHSVDVVLHLDRATETRRNEEWIGEAKRAGLEFDCVGLSYHPTLGEHDLPHTLQNLEHLSDVAPGCLLFAEVAYPGSGGGAKPSDDFLTRVSRDGRWSATVRGDGVFDAPANIECVGTGLVGRRCPTTQSKLSRTCTAILPVRRPRSGRRFPARENV